MKKTIQLGIAAIIAATPLAQAGDFGTSIIAPKQSIRDLAADRPDSTESPVTVDKGMWQIETSVLSFAKDNDGTTRRETWTWGETNLKYGITNDMDLQLIFAPYIYERTTTGGAVNKVEDASDVTLRLKWNLWGNDGGKTALALFPYVKVPTGTKHSNGAWEGGLIIPFSVELNDKWGLGLQAEFASVRDDADGDYDLEFLHTAVLGYSVTDKLGVYVEYLGIASSDSNPYQSHASGGVTYAFTNTFQWDAGAVYGINDAAEDLNVFTGFTTKF